MLWGQGVLGTLTPEFFQRAVAQLENKGLGEFEPQVGWLAPWQAQLLCHPLLLTALVRCCCCYTEVLLPCLSSTLT